MKKLGILTLYYKNYNFGGQLQAYALQSFLSKKRYKVEQIQFDYFTYTETKLDLLKRKLVLQKHRVFNPDLYEDEIKLIKRKKKFDKFITSIPHSKKIYRENNITELNSVYERIVCGGDQIWNDWNGASWICKDSLFIFSLGFVNDDKIAFSYAPSMGRADLTEKQRTILMDSFIHLRGISIREKSNKREVSNLTDKKINVVVDPVFLLTCEDWNELINDESKRDEKYAFCYFLSKDSCRLKYIKKFVKENGLITINVPNSAANMSMIDRDEEWGDINDYESGPIEFIKNIRDSRIVLTDSFHAVVFSIIYHKEFYVFGRTDSNSEMNNRIYDLLDEYGLKDRYINDVVDLLTIADNHIDYKMIDIKLKANRDKSIKFIKDSIGDE